MIAQRLVSLTFDGTTIGHLEVVAPLLWRLGLPATFYACAENLLQAVRDWQEVAAWGYEIGDGCLVGAARSDGHVPLTRTAIAAELEASGDLLDGLFSGERSFGFPWGAPSCADGDYRDLVIGRYDLARAGIEGRNTKTATDFAFLKCLPCDGYSGSELIDLAENGLAAEEWVIFAFCGVGEGERAVDLGAFTALAEHLARTDAPCVSVIEGAGLWRSAMAAL